MLLFLVVLALVVVLFAANMEHRSSFSFIFGHLEEVPVFMALLLAFIAGALTMLPFTVGRHRQRGRKQKKPADSRGLPEAQQSHPSGPQIGAPYEAPPDGDGSARKRKTRPRRRAGRA
jgi:uncharacterized integral membrane protein